MCVPSDLFFFSKYICRKDSTFPPCLFYEKKKKVSNYGSILSYFFPVVYLGDMLMPKHTGELPTAYCLVFIV